MRYFTSICGTLLLLAGGCGAPSGSPGDVESRHGPFRILLGGVDHNDITEQGLFFLDTGTADEIGDYNEDTDLGSTQKLSRYHVDNCYITEAFRNMKSLYDDALVYLNPAAPRIQDAKRAFGTILHTTQDFYAHTNWVDAGQTAYYDVGSFDLPIPEVRTFLGPMMVATEALPASFLVELPPGSRVPTVFIGGVPSGIGLISGTFPNNEPSICPLAASIPHGDRFDQGPFGTFLAKDDPDSPNHAVAAVLATGQTTQEFCRLARLVMLQYGEPGFELLMSGFKVVAPAEYEADCPYDRGMVAAVHTAPL